jgi:hypothetical protein
VAGNAVADVTHILAELLENATRFSPPGSPVVVGGMLAERRFVVSITDEGIGMDDARMAAANLLLQAPPPPGLSLSRTLGLHVVAHLAARYGVRVQLRRSAANGVTAIVALPASVLTRVDTGSIATPAASGSPLPPTTTEAATRAGFAAPSGPAFVAPPPTGAPVTPEVVTAAAAPWAESEFAPPAFDPASAVPPAAVPVEPTSGMPRDFVTPADGLPRRAPGATPLGSDGRGLPQRSPGDHLSHRPDDVAPPSGDSRPRPERVHDLLTRHLRGIRDGRISQSAGVGTDPYDAEDRS